MNKFVRYIKTHANFLEMLQTELLQAFEPITLDEMGKVRLMNRVDTKYVTTSPKLEQLLQMAKSEYRIQQIGSLRNMPYYTCYFDTSDTRMFYEHHRGRKARKKVRMRLYEGNNTPPYIEIKIKNNRGLTKKKRMLMEYGDDLSPYADFIRTYSSFEQEDLTRQIENHFYRVTLVNHAMTERITIDTELQFHNFITDSRGSLPGVAVVEWKRDGLANNSPMQRLLRELHIHSAGFSKYCVGMAMTNPCLRQNRLKQKLRNLDRLCSGTGHSFCII